MTYIAYTAGALFILLGLAIILPLGLFPAYLPVQFKYMMGIVLFLYGFFRIIYTTFKNKKRKRDEEAI